MLTDADHNRIADVDNYRHMLSVIVEHLGFKFTVDDIEDLRRRAQNGPTAIYRIEYLMSTCRKLSGEAADPVPGSALASAFDFVGDILLKLEYSWAEGKVLATYTVNPRVPDLLAQWQQDVAEFEEQVRLDREELHRKNREDAIERLHSGLRSWHRVLGVNTDNALPTDIKSFFEALLSQPTAAVPTETLNQLYASYV